MKLMKWWHDDNKEKRKQGDEQHHENDDNYETDEHDTRTRTWWDGCELRQWWQ